MQLKTTVEFLMAIKAKHKLTSDGQLARLLGLTRSGISVLMLGKSHLGDESAMKVADLLDIDPAYVVACVHIERAKREEEKKLWERIATLAMGATIGLVAFFALPFVVLPNGDSSIVASAEELSTVYYVK